MNCCYLEKLGDSHVKFLTEKEVMLTENGSVTVSMTFKSVYANGLVMVLSRANKSETVFAAGLRNGRVCIFYRVNDAYACNQYNIVTLSVILLSDMNKGYSARYAQSWPKKQVKHFEKISSAFMAGSVSKCLYSSKTLGTRQFLRTITPFLTHTGKGESERAPHR